MNRRIFCKSAALSYFLLPFLSSKLFANTKGSGIFLGELIINGKKTNSFIILILTKSSRIDHLIYLPVYWSCTGFEIFNKLNFLILNSS